MIISNRRSLNLLDIELIAKILVSFATRLFDASAEVHVFVELYIDLYHPMWTCLMEYRRN